MKAKNVRLPLLLIIISLAIVSFSHRHVLALPLIFTGLALLIIGNMTKEREGKSLNLFLLNAGVLSLISGISFGIANAVYLLSPKVVKKPWTKDSNHYENYIAQSPGNYRLDDQGLGYRYKPNSRNLKSIRLAITPESTHTIYNVRYNINEYGNRYLPLIAPSDKSVLFLGDSLTFGEGLNDNETLPYYFSEQSGIHSINTGLHGYGAHQGLRLIQNNSVYHERTEGKDIKSVVYRPIFNHINRSAGYSPWDSYGPCYEINSDSSKIEYKGSFASCKKRSFARKLIDKILGRMGSSVEPWTSNLATQIKNYRYNNDKYLERDYKRFVEIIVAMKKYAEVRGASFYLIIENMSGPPTCGKLDISPRLEKDMTKNNIQFIRSSDYLSESECKLWHYHISRYDGHPTAVANKILARALYRKYFYPGSH